MAQLQLSSMEASDMLDVLHFYFEEDNSYPSEEQLASTSSVRTAVYETWYDRPYKYKYTPKKKSTTAGENGPEYSESPTQDFGDVDADGDVIPFNPKAEKPKAYVEPTEMNGESAMPFGNTLDAPLGG